MSYIDGFEDATELCLVTLEKSENKQQGIGKLKEYLGLLKEQKFARLETMLGVLKETEKKVTQNE